MEKHHNHVRELHLLPIPPPPLPPETSTSHHLPPLKPAQPPTFHHHHTFDTHAPPLDLQLSISLASYKPPLAPRQQVAPARRVEVLRWQAAEQTRLAAKEKAYIERIRELTRREMEMAQSELAKAQILWERSKEEVARAERIKLNSIIRVPNYTNQVGSSTNSSNTCMEITCRCCRRRFRV